MLVTPQGHLRPRQGRFSGTDRRDHPENNIRELGIFTLLALLFGSSVAAAQSPDGGAVYRSNCASCHESVAAHAPARNLLRKMSPEGVLKILETGSMKPMAASLTRAEKRAVAEYVAGKTFGTAPAPIAPNPLFLRESVRKFRRTLSETELERQEPGLGKCPISA